MTVRCFLCGKPMKPGMGNRAPHLADTHEDQWVYVGADCAKRIADAGDAGHPTRGGGIRLWPMTAERWAYFERNGMGA